MNFNKERFKESLAKRLSSQFNQEFKSEISNHDLFDAVSEYNAGLKIGGMFFTQ